MVINVVLVILQIINSLWSFEVVCIAWTQAIGLS